MIGYPLDSQVTYESDGTPVWDRAISSEPLRKLIKELFSDGVLPNPSTNLQITATTGETVKVLAGFGLCDGCLKLQEEDIELEMPAADDTYDRIDTVVLRLNSNVDVRSCDFFVVKGTAESSPQAPALTQTKSVWEIGLANVYRKAKSTEITNSSITDTRYDTERCGIISSISEFDTTTLYQQIQTDLEEFRNVNQAEYEAWEKEVREQAEKFETSSKNEFYAWFDEIKDKLTEDQAGNLLTMIEELNKNIGNLEDLDTEEKTSIVNAINETNTKVDNLPKIIYATEEPAEVDKNTIVLVYEE